MQPIKRLLLPAIALVLAAAPVGEARRLTKGSIIRGHPDDPPPGTEYMYSYCYDFELQEAGPLLVIVRNGPQAFTAHEVEVLPEASCSIPVCPADSTTPPPPPPCALAWNTPLAAAEDTFVRTGTLAPGSYMVRFRGCSPVQSCQYEVTIEVYEDVCP